MTDGGIFTPIIPEIDGAGVERVARLIAREKAAGIDSAALRRLAALLPPDSKVADLAGARLKLSNKARKRLVLAHDPAWADICKPAELAYRIGRESATDRLLLDTARPADEAASLKWWEKPVLPIGGGVLVKKGLRAGPRSEEQTSELQSLMRISYAVF